MFTCEPLSTFSRMSHVALVILNLNFCSDCSYKQWRLTVILLFFFFCPYPMDFLSWTAHALEVMLFLAIVTCFGICWAFSYTMSCATVSAIKYLDWAGTIFVGWGRLSEWWFFFLPCTAGSFAMSPSCISVASVDRTTSIAFSRVRSEILSNLSLVLVSLMPSTILSLIREFSNALNSRLTRLSQHSNILINGFATFLGPWKEVFSRFTVFLEFL